MPSDPGGPLFTTPLHAAAWLRDRAAQDPDIKALLHLAYTKFQVSSISDLDPQFVVELYESVAEADLDVELMEEADTETRARLAEVKWEPRWEESRGDPAD